MSRPLVEPARSDRLAPAAAMAADENIGAGAVETMEEAEGMAAFTDDRPRRAGGRRERPAALTPRPARNRPRSLPAR